MGTQATSGADIHDQAIRLLNGVSFEGRLYWGPEVERATVGQSYVVHEVGESHAWIRVSVMDRSGRALYVGVLGEVHFDGPPPSVVAPGNTPSTTTT